MNLYAHSEPRDDSLLAMIVLLSPVITFTFSMRRVMQNNFLIGQKNAQLNFLTKRSPDPKFEIPQQNGQKVIHVALPVASSQMMTFMLSLFIIYA